MVVYADAAEYFMQCLFAGFCFAIAWYYLWMWALGMGVMGFRAFVQGR